MDAVMKGLVIAIGIYDTMLWRSLIAVGFSALLWVGLHRRRPTRAALRLPPVRGAVSTAIALLFFWGLGRVPLAQALPPPHLAPPAPPPLAASPLPHPLPPAPQTPASAHTASPPPPPGPPPPH